MERVGFDAFHHTTVGIYQSTKVQTEGHTIKVKGLKRAKLQNFFVNYTYKGKPGMWISYGLTVT